jgi:hypothetical protein
MKKWNIPVMIAIVALLMPMSSAMVGAQNGAGLSISKSAALTSATIGDNITYTSTITNTDNATINKWLLFKAEILKLMGVAGKGIEKALGLQKPFNPKSQAAARAANTDNVTQTDNITQTKAEILELSGVKGKGIDTAPGLQKPFNPRSQAAEHAGKKDKDNDGDNEEK